MARRSPLNARYQKYQEPAGKTRKSAASAKPKKGDAAGKSGAKSKAVTKAPVRRGAVFSNPDTPEFRKLRRVWWALIISAFALTTVAWLLLRNLQQRSASNYVLIGAYALMFIAFWLDWTKLRPLRQQHVADLKSGKKPEKPSKPESGDDEKN